MTQWLAIILTVVALAGCRNTDPTKAIPAPQTSGQTPPVIATAEIETRKFGRTEILTVTPKGWVDPLGSSISVSYLWFVNDTALPGQVTASLSGGYLHKGDKVYVQVTPAVGNRKGLPVNSEVISIRNDPPIVGQVSLGEGPFFRDSVLSAFVETYDADGDTVVLNYQWKVNGILLADEHGASPTGDYFRKYDQVTVTPLAHDGEDESGAFESDRVEIRNSPPRAPVVEVYPQFVSTDTPAMWVAMVTAAVDIDGDPITYSYVWRKDNVEQPFASSLTIVTNENFSEGQVWRATVRTKDDDDNAPDADSSDHPIYALATTVSAGGYHTCAISKKGQLYCWGSSDYGQLGNGSYVKSLSPLKIPIGNERFSDVQAGFWHTCALTTGGSVYCWGIDGYGDLGDNFKATNPPNRNYPLPVSGLVGNVDQLVAGGRHTCARKKDATVVCWGNIFYPTPSQGPFDYPVAITELTNVQKLTAGANFTCALISRGTAKCWGDTVYGALGIGTVNFIYASRPSDVVGLAGQVIDIDAGNNHTCAVLSGGNIQCWGNNEYFQLGNGTDVYQTSPNGYTLSITNAVAVGSGYWHTCAKLADTTLTCWGSNAAGQLGQDVIKAVVYEIYAKPHYEPVSVMRLEPGVQQFDAGRFMHMCAVLSRGALRCWGGAVDYGTIGDGEQLDYPLPRFADRLATGALGIVAGGGFSCAIVTTLKVWCWGANGQGQLGDGSVDKRPEPGTDVINSSDAASLAASVKAACLVSTSGALRCWGASYQGQAAKTSAVAISGLTSGVASVAMSPYHICALTTAGDVKCFGLNNRGILGVGNLATSYTPILVSGLPEKAKFIAVGGGTQYQTGAGNSIHTCAIGISGAVYCWGANEVGQIGDGTTVDRSSPTLVAGVTQAVALALGHRHTCAIVTNGKVSCWGRNSFGQLGDGTTIDRLSPVVVGSLSNISSLSAGYDHTCAIDPSGVKCWGNNDSGQVGNGTISEPVNVNLIPEKVEGLSQVKAISSGPRHNCALVAKGGMKCWGSNRERLGVYDPSYDPFGGQIGIFGPRSPLGFLP